MAGNEELWEFRAVDAGFVATTQILAAEIDYLKKSSAELTKNFVEGNKKNKLSIEELTAKIAENTEKVRAGSDILRERLKIITDTKQAVIDYNAAIQQSTAAKGPYVPGGTDYMSGANPSLMEFAETNAARQKEIADEVTAYHKRKYIEDLAAYSANWRQKIDLDREESAAKVANLQDEKRIHDAIEAQKNAEFDEKVNRNLRRLREEKDARLQIERELRDFQVRFADEVAARDRMQYVANTGPEASDKAQKISALRTEYQRLEKQYESLAREAANYRTEAANGSEVAARAAAKIQETMLGVETKLKDVNRQLESTHGFRGMRTMFVEGSRAAQDFLTVLSMPGMGLTEAIRAASNNLEVMAMNAGFTNAKLMMLATMMPSVIQGTMALYGWLTKESKAATEAAEAEHKRHEAFAKQVGTMKDYNDHLSKMNELRGEAKDKVNGLVEVEGKLVDLRRAEMNRETQEALSDTINRQREIKDRIRDAREQSIKAGKLPGPAGIAAAWELQAALLDAPKLPGLERNERTLRDKLLRNNEVRDAEIAKAEIDNQLRSQDEVLKKRATLEAAAVMEGFATAEGAAGRLAKSTGVNPKGEGQERYFKNRIQRFLDDQTEEVAAKRFSSDNNEREMTAEQRRAKDKAFMKSVIDKELEDENLRIEQAKRKKDDFEKKVNESRLFGGRERPFIDGKSTVKTRKDLEQEIRDRERERDDERKRLEKSMGLDPVVAMGMLKGINRLVELFERDGAPEVAAVPGRARVFGKPMRNPDIASFEPGMA